MLKIETVSKQIKSIKTRSTNIRNDIQLVVSNASEIASQDGNAYLLTRLLSAVGTGSRRDALVRHIETHTPCRSRVTKSASVVDFFTVNGKKYVFSVEKGWKASDFDLKAMREVNKDTGTFTFPWFNAIREPNIKPNDMLKKVQNAIKSYFNDMENGKPVVKGQDTIGKELATILKIEV